VSGDCVSLWRDLPDGFAHLLFCHMGDSLKITFDSFYDGEFTRYTVVREFRDYAHTWDELLTRAREDPQGLWRQALKDITDDYHYRKKMESVLKVAQAVLNDQ
jgi:hypothetical protein